MTKSFHVYSIIPAVMILAACAAHGQHARFQPEEADPVLISMSDRLESVLLHGELPEIDELAGEQRAALLHPQFGYAGDYAAWVNDVLRYNRMLEDEFYYATPSIIDLATDDPINAAWQLDAWARQMTAGESGVDTAFAQLIRLLDELPAVGLQEAVPAAVQSRQPSGFEPAIDDTLAALVAAAEFVDTQALGEIPAEHRELMSFVLPLICRSGGRFVNHSQDAPQYFMAWQFHPPDTFAPGDTETSLSQTPVPPEIYSLTGLGRYLHALANQPVPPGTLFMEQEGEHPEFTGAVDFSALRSAVEMLSKILSAEALDELAASLAELQPMTEAVPGVTGDVLNLIETPYGCIIVGGTGSNRYTDPDYLAIIDIGGDDEYAFTGTESVLGKRPLQVIVDFAGDDLYSVDGVGGPAAGVLGVNILIDRAGADRYVQGLSPRFNAREHTRETLVLPDPEGVNTSLVPYVMLYGDPHQPEEPGVALDAGFAFGAGFLGVGMLVDEGGNDLYLGQKFAFGTGFWSGVGVLHDAHGDDVYAAGIGAVGAGINGAFGLLDDRSGNDHYQCLGTFESSYSAGREWDNGYCGHGIGYGSSWRAESRLRRAVTPTLGGGTGLVYDSAGNDSYIGSSFGVAAGYAGGMGMIADQSGDDTYFVKRGPDGSNHSGWSGNHALGNGCHRGVGYLLDRAGNDRYSASSLGGGTAWDRGVGFLIDLGGDDRMTDLHGKNVRGNTGWGAAMAFAVSFHRGGADVYERGTFADASAVPAGYPGVGGNFSFFFDIGPEEDTYFQNDWNDTIRLGWLAWEEQDDGGEYPRGLGLFVDAPDF